MTSPAGSTSIGLDDSADSALDWTRRNARQVGIAALAVAALIVVVYLVRASNARKETNAGRALTEAQRSVATENLPLAAADLQKLVDRYGSTRAGTQGRLLLAQVLLQQGKHEEALKTLDGVGSAGPLGASVHALRAGSLEQKGSLADAAGEYLKAADIALLPAEAESYRADAARAYLQAGKKDESLRIWQGMAADPSSPLYGEAQLRIGELTARAK